MSTFNNLDNREILFVYFNNLIWLEIYEEVFEKGEISQKIELLGVGYITTSELLDEEEVREMQYDNPHYKLIEKIHEKLHPIVELIKDSMPELYNEVLEIVKNVENETRV
jgi:hypothetical protein